jgi:hypothetical protein
MMHKFKDALAHTDIKQAPWYGVQADNKKRARLNCISHLLSPLNYKDLITPCAARAIVAHAKRDGLYAAAVRGADLRGKALVARSAMVQLPAS